MSKLTEKLRRVGASEAAPMGFGFGARAARHPQLAVVAELPSADAEAVAKAVADGADAVLVTGADSAAAVKAIVAAAGKAPVGVRLTKDAGRAQIEELVREGADFVVLEGLDTPAAVLRAEGAARLLTIDPDWPELVWRSLEALPLEGGYLRLPSAAPLTLAGLLLLGRANGVSRRTLVLSVPAVDEEMLTVLRDAGLVCVATPPTVVADAKRLAAALPPRRKRDRNHFDALVPSGGPAAALAADEDDD